MRQEALQRGRLSGICRKVLIFILVGIANVIDIACDRHRLGVLRTAVIFFYISNEGLSLIENAAHLGLPIPGKLKAVLEQLHDRSANVTATGAPSGPMPAAMKTPAESGSTAPMAPFPASMAAWIWTGRIRTSHQSSLAKDLMGILGQEAKLLCQQ
jgi:hypothetical protein